MFTPTATARPPAGRETVAALVTAAQAGNTEAFGEIYVLYKDTVFRYINYRVCAKHLAEDLTSETFLRALRHIGSFTSRGGDIGAWLVTIAGNLIADHFKCCRVRLEVSVADMRDFDRPEPGPEDIVMAQMVNAALHEAIGRLSELQRRCVYLRFICGMSVAETSAAMGRREVTTKNIQYRAVRTLEETFGSNRSLALAGAR